MRADEILDIAESVELAMTPATDACFEKALDDLKIGQVFGPRVFQVIDL